MARITGPKAEIKKTWKPFSADDYRITAASLIHFSAKTVNSNTPAFGVRLGKRDRLDLPYVAVSTMDSQKVPADYEKNAGSTATVLAQISATLEGRLADFESVPPRDVAAIREAINALDEHYETPSFTVGMRLRQIVVQDENGNDVALTPLPSAGFSTELEARLRAEGEQLPGGRKRPRSFLGVGGANPQNAGRHVRAMGRPLWFSAPTENREIRKALAIYFRGIPLTVPKALLYDYYHWRQGLLAAHRGLMPSDLELRNTEAQKLRAMVGAVLDRAEAASTLLANYRHHLPGDALLSGDLPACQQGLIDPALRNMEWVREFAAEMHQSLLQLRIAVHGEPRFLGIGQTESARWISIIEEIV